MAYNITYRLIYNILGGAMPELLTVKKISELWNMEERKITALCREGRIIGALKHG